MTSSAHMGQHLSSSMRSFRRLILVICFIMQYYYYPCSTTTTTTTSHRRLCRPDQRSALLEFKHTLMVSGDASSSSCHWSFHHEQTNPVPRIDESFHPNHSKTVSWKEESVAADGDCCLWEGVTCDRSTGHVVGLDLSCSQLRGTLHPNSSLFQLSHLRRFNLAFNDFSGSRIPSAFGRFASLTHLNLSQTYFHGPVPSTLFTHLPKIVSLDLSDNTDPNQALLSVEAHKFKNLTQLQQLSLAYVSLSSSSSSPHDSFFMNLSSLTLLDLFRTDLRGKLPHFFQSHPNLQRLNLGGSYDLTGNLREVNWSSSIMMRDLVLSLTGVSGEVPEAIGNNLKYLNYLDLSGGRFSGSVPSSLGNFTQLTHLYLGYNNFSGQFPSTALSNLKQLKSLGLGGGNNSFASGPFPAGWFLNQTQLVDLDLWQCGLTGPIPSNKSGGCGLQNLQFLDVSENRLCGTIPSWMFTLPSLEVLILNTNQLTGKIPEFQYNSALKCVALGENELDGPIPQSISNLTNLLVLDLSSNKLSGIVELLHTIPNLENLEQLYISDNSLSLRTTSSNNINATLPNLVSLGASSCKVDKFPTFLRASKILEELDLSNNQIHGQIPEWLGLVGRDTLYYLNFSHNSLTGGIEQLFVAWKNLQTIDLHSNLLQGPLPVLPPFTSYFLISNNSLSGEIPLSICNASQISIIDLSHNRLTGAIPQCLGYFSTYLSVLDLRSNGFQGTIPSTFGQLNVLRNLELNGNQLQGPLPQSLINCSSLAVLDVGHNKINDAFPCWLGTLPKLRVLVLRSNKFHGPIDTSKTNLPAFSKLRIIDISHNEFTGHLPTRYFKCFESMRNVVMDNTKYMGDGYPYYYHDSIAVAMKGGYVELTRILNIFTTIDLSSNNFSGEVPSAIGRLNSLKVLNLSHNSLTGHIPMSLGDLANLESLDLSANQLSGSIPTRLTSLTFLEVLNLSQNHLNGPIPRGKQFDTFENNSYFENSGLCGSPLSKGCHDQDHNQAGVLLPVEMFKQEDHDLEYANSFTWKVVLMGYGCGAVLGVAVGCLMWFTGKPRWFAKFGEGIQRRNLKSIKPIGHKRGVRRNRHTSRHFQVTAVQLDLIGRVWGLHAAEIFFHRLNEQEQVDKIYGALLNSYVLGRP